MLLLPQIRSLNQPKLITLIATMIIMMITATASATITLKAAKKTKITKKTNEKAVFKEKLEAQLQEV